MNKIPLSVSSTLKNISGMSPMAVTPYANLTGKTGEAAPVLIAVESAGTVDAAAFAAALPAKGGQGTASQARLVVNALAQVLSDLVAEYGAITVSTPFGRVDTFVAGSLEYATDPADPEVNVPFLGIVPGADVMKAFAQIEAYVPTAACPASLKRIRDVETGAGVIRGTKAFYAQGYGMTYGSTGETVKLLNALTRAEVCTVAVDATTKSKAQLKCTLPGTTAIPAGVYILQVKTLAGGGAMGGTLWPLELKVNLAEAVVPPPAVPKIDKIVDVMHLDSPTDYVGSDQTGIQLAGENLALAGYQLTMEYRTSAEAAWQAFSGYEVAQATANAISLTSQATAQQLGASDYRFTVTNAKGTATRTVAISA